MNNIAYAARYSPIGNIAVLQHLQHQGLLGDYLLLLTHDILRHKRDYARLVNEIQSKNRMIIVDNSLIELGTALPVAQVIEAASIVHGDVIVLPDVLSDSGGTLQVLQAAYRELQIQYTDGPYPKGMIVSQGRTQEEVNKFVDTIHDIGINPEWWGVPRIITNTLGSRLPTVEYITDKCNGMCNIHLLGMSQDFSDDLGCLYHPFVAGIDSANPLVMGMHGKVFGQHSYIHLGREGYWDMLGVTTTMAENVKSMHKLARGGGPQ